MKRGRYFHGDGITLNKKAQTGESSKQAGRTSLQFDAAYPLNNGGSFAVECKGNASDGRRRR